MCRQTSVLNKIAFTIFVLGCLAAALSFAAPFWIRTAYNVGFLKQWGSEAYHGLWGACCPDDNQPAGFACTWVWHDYYSFQNNLPSCAWSNTYATINDLPAWFKASQIIFCFALGFLFLSLLLQSVYNCCRCCKSPTCFPTAVGAIAFAGAILVGLSLGLYGGFSYKEGVFDAVLSGGRGGRLDWAFYVGIAGAAACFVAAVMFFVDGCFQTKHYGGYKSPALGTQ